MTGEHIDPTMLKVRYELTDNELEEWARGETDVNEQGKPLLECS